MGVPARTRRRNIWFLVALGFLALVVTRLATDRAPLGDNAFPGSTPPPENRLPNVLIIITDDQRTDTFTTVPETRQFFEDGINFTHAFATTPVCCPSRASIFSGRFAHNHGVKEFNPMTWIKT